MTTAWPMHPYARAAHTASRTDSYAYAHSDAHPSASAPNLPASPPPPPYIPNTDPKGRPTFKFISSSSSARVRPLPTIPPSPSRPLAYSKSSRSVVNAERESDLPAALFEKQESIITLVLSGHTSVHSGPDGEVSPVFTSGGVLSGRVSLAKTKASSISSVTVTLEANTRIQELAGGGHTSTSLLSAKLCSWDRVSPTPSSPYPPTEFSFRIAIPATDANGRVLPPSYEARAKGFQVSIRYEVVVCVVRTQMEVWKRRCRLRVPFAYVPRTRPLVSGPFPPRLKAAGIDHPQTAFIDIITTRRQYVPPIQTQLYLPNSQITPLTATIPFCFTLTAPDAYLAPFMASNLALSSFLPMSTEYSKSDTGSYPASFTGSTQQKEDSPHRPVRVHLERTTQVDASHTGVVVFGFDMGTVKGHSSAMGLAGGGRRGIASTAVIAEGIVRMGERGEGWVRWWGEVGVPRAEREKGMCGGIAAERVVVTDAVVVTVDMSGLGSHVFPFRQRVPVRFTSDVVGNPSAVGVSDVPDVEELALEELLRTPVANNRMTACQWLAFLVELVSREPERGEPP